MQAVISADRLNPSQSAALRSAAAWLAPDPEVLISNCTKLLLHHDLVNRSLLPHYQHFACYRTRVTSSRMCMTSGGQSGGAHSRSIRQRQEHLAGVYHTLPSTAGVLPAPRLQCFCAADHMSGHPAHSVVTPHRVHVQLQQIAVDHPLRGARILVAAHTNTAVDRIMTGLLETHCKGDVVQLFLGSLHAPCVHCKCTVCCAHAARKAADNLVRKAAC